MTDFADSTVATTTSYTALLQSLRDRNNAVARQLDGSHTNLPTGAVRWNSAQDRWEKYDGSAWNPLSSLYNMNVSQLQGYQTSTGATADTIALRDAAGRLKAAAPSASTDVARKAEVDAHTGRTDNPHSVTKTQVGLSNVSNDQQLVRAQNLQDLPDKPAAYATLGGKSAGTKESSEFATSAQGNKADSALQPGDPIDASQLGGFPASNYTRMEHRQSPQYTLSSGDVLFWYHYESQIPDHAWIELVCVNANNGFNVGDRMEGALTFSSSELSPYSIRKQTSFCSVALTTQSPRVLRQVSGSGAGFQSVQWGDFKMVIHAVWYRS